MTWGEFVWRSLRFFSVILFCLWFCPSSPKCSDGSRYWLLSLYLVRLPFSLDTFPMCCLLEKALRENYREMWTSCVFLLWALSSVKLGCSPVPSSCFSVVVFDEIVNWIWNGFSWPELEVTIWHTTCLFVYMFIVCLSPISSHPLPPTRI